jgi:hypothetical protein
MEKGARDMNIEILDGCGDNSFRKLGGIARGVALLGAHGKFIAGAAAPVNNSSVLNPFQTYFRKYR